MSPDEIRQALADWKRNTDRRNELVRLAREADIEITEIRRLTGLSRVTIYKILGLEPGDNTPLSASGGGSGAGQPE